MADPEYIPLPRAISKDDEVFMLKAMEQAQKAFELGEAPVGAVIVNNGQVISQAFNRIELDKDPTAHAEIVAIREAARLLGDWRLPYSTLYVTLEPCVMCASALLHARVPRVVYAAQDFKWGGLGSLFDLSHDPRLNHEIEVIPGVLKDMAASLMKEFFVRLRNR